jgi:uncharacterized protein YacL
MTVLLTAINTAGLVWVLYLLLGKQPKKEKGILLDSCALIDGRIVEVMQSGFIHEPVIVPKYVLRELQMLADGSDNHKRARARYGLEASEKLRQLLGEMYSVDESDVQAATTDDRLVLLAKKRRAKLCTTDYNLNKVAGSEGITVLNVNELAHAMRPHMLPGEEQEVKILQKGEGRNQGVGYLDDGTMVVVENAAKHIGTKQFVVIERSLQTVAGKMSFAHLKYKKQRS